MDTAKFFPKGIIPGFIFNEMQDSFGNVCGSVIVHVENISDVTEIESTRTVYESAPGIGAIEKGIPTGQREVRIGIKNSARAFITFHNMNMEQFMRLMLIAYKDIELFKEHGTEILT